jgi:hypothetical protein
MQTFYSSPEKVKNKSIPYLQKRATGAEIRQKLNILRMHL